jgi:DNA replication and repair protein RecF
VTLLSPVHIRRLELEQFRAYTSVELSVPAAGLRVVGPNGSGKSTLIEALLLLSTTRSRRGAQDSDLIRHESGVELGVVPYARVLGEIDRGGVTVHLDVTLENQPERSTTRKVLKVADRPRRAVDVVGLLPTVAFSPEDLDLVLGSPPIRRRWLDVVLSQTDRKYLRFLSRYGKILSQRNGLLKQGNNNGNSPSASEFTYWDEQLTALGAYIIAARALAVARIAASASIRFTSLAPEVELLGLEYQSPLNQPPVWWDALVSGQPSADDVVQRVGAVYEFQMGESLTSDLARGSTQIGPHRDDVAFTLGGRPLTRFGSRGQQRLAVVALKLAEADFMAAVTDLRPVFMLDDVLSELDPDHRQSLVETVRENGSQIIVTATEGALLSGENLGDLGLAELASPGELTLR